MRYLVYAFMMAAVTVGVALVPTTTDRDVQYADAPRVDRVTVENTKLVCVENRCYDANKLPARYRSLVSKSL